MNQPNPNKLTSYVARLLSVFSEWELFSNTQIQSACAALLAIARSQLSFVLAEDAHLDHIADLINSQNTPLQVQLSIVEAVIHMSSSLAVQKRIVS